VSFLVKYSEAIKVIITAIIVAISCMCSFFVLVQRGEEGAFAKPTKKTQTENTVLIKVTAVLGVVFLFLMLIFGIILNKMYFSHGIY